MRMECIRRLRALAARVGAIGPRGPMVLLVGVLCWAPAPGTARAEEARITAASSSASPYPDAEQGVHRLFDTDDVTTFCVREKVKISVTARLSQPAFLSAAYLSLGDPNAWTQKPRVKQVYVSVMLGDRLVKKVRHKWPDRDEARDGKVNLGAVGDGVVVEFDKSYAGRLASAGLCLAGLRLETTTPDGAFAVDAADLAAQSWTSDQLTNALARRFTVAAGGQGAATLELARRGKLVYRDDARNLKVEGRWKIDDPPSGGRRLVFELTRVKTAGKRTRAPAALARYFAAWRFQPLADGEAPTFVPWEAFGVDEQGGLTRVAPQSVQPAP